MLRIGLTGGIGSGKSAVAQILSEQDGVRRIDADEIARQLTGSGGQAMPVIVQKFGAHMTGADGALNRDAMRALLLEQAEAKAQLEAILHPLIGLQIAQRMAQAEQGGCAATVAEIPLLVEAGARWRSQFDAVWVVDCAESMQMARVQARSAWSVQHIQAMMDAQAKREQRLACADVVLYNDGLSWAQLRQISEQALAGRLKHDRKPRT